MNASNTAAPKTVSEREAANAHCPFCNALALDGSSVTFAIGPTFRTRWESLSGDDRKAIEKLTAALFSALIQHPAYVSSAALGLSLTLPGASPETDAEYVERAR